MPRGRNRVWKSRASSACSIRLPGIHRHGRARIRAASVPDSGTTSGMQLADTRTTLQAYGYNELFAERFAPYGEQGLLPARVIVEYQNIYRVITEDDGELLATVSGR